MFCFGLVHVSLRLDNNRHGYAKADDDKQNRRADREGKCPRIAEGNGIGCYEKGYSLEKCRESVRDALLNLVRQRRDGVGNGARRDLVQNAQGL